MLPEAGKTSVAWEPHGLWDPEEYVPLARDLGVVPVFDPFMELPIKQGRATACFSLYTRRGLRTSFNDFDMEELLELCAPYQRAIVIFRGPKRFRDARLAQTILEAQQALEI
jgi:ADP-heptose:LPS heptosyltransferase